jgi:hypothetical protein
MKKKIFAFLTLLLFILGFAGAQDIKLKADEYSLNLPEGIVHFDIDKSRMTIRFEDSVTQEQRVTFFKSLPSIFKPYQSDWELFTERVILAKIDSSISDEAYLNAVTQIQQSPLFKYTAPVLTYNGKYMQALYDLLFVHLKKPEDIDTLKHFANIFKLELDQSGGQLIRCRLTKNSRVNTFEIAKYLQSFNLFEFAEPDFIFFSKQNAVNDPGYVWQWGLENFGNNIQIGTSDTGNVDADIDIEAAWSLFPGGSTNVKVAVLDCFGDYSYFTHPDISFFKKIDATGLNWLQNNIGGYTAVSDNAHGISCAGIIAASANNNLGIVGISYNSKAIAIRLGQGIVGDEWVSTSNWIANAIDSAWTNADIISNSNAFSTVPQSVINAAITRANTLGRLGKGSLFITSTGNDNGNINYPSSNGNTISIGATDPCDYRVSPTSCNTEGWGGNYGVGLDVSAPGIKIYTTDIVGSAGKSNGDYYPTFNGTSAACPMAAGVMALILSANPNLTGQDARTVLEVTCDKVGGYSYNNNFGLQPNGTWSNDLGYGRVNAGKAVYSALVTSSCPDFDFSLSPTTNWLTDTKTMTDNLWNIYRVPVNAGNTYSFKTGCGNGATANFQTSLVLLNSSCDTITNATSVCSNPTNTEVIDWTATYTGYAFLKVRASNWINGTYTLAYRYTAPTQACNVSVSPTSKTVTYPAGSTTFSLSGSGNWTISESCPWISNVSPSSGNGNATIAVTYLANGTLSSRSCTLTATCGSNTSNFTLNQNAPTLSLSAPSNGSSGLSCSGINFSWSSNISNVQYRLQISTSNTWTASGGFSSTVLNIGALSSPSYTWTGGQANTTYYWCVRAYDVTNQVYTDFTTYRGFSTGSCGSSSCYATVNLQDPPDNYFHGGCIGNDLIFTWTPQSSCPILEYEIQFSPGTSFTNVYPYYTTDPYKVILQTTNSTNTSSLYWRVRARTASGWGTFSSYREFFTIACNGSSCNDPYEPNDAASLASAYNIMPVNFVNSEFHFKSSGACTDDSESDWDDYYRIDLPSGYYYSVESRLHDTHNSSDGVSHTGDMEYRYNDGNGWSATFEDTQHPAFGVMDGGTIRFHIEPWNNSAGFDGTYSLEVNVYRYQNNLKPYKPVSWDEPLVTSLSAGTNSNSSSFTTADAIYVDIAHINSSLATSGSFNTKLYIDGVTAYNYSSNGLQANSWETVQDISTGHLSAGWHEFKLFVDPGNDITESNENDNEYVKSIYVSPAYPDLLPYTPSGWSNPLVISNTTGTSTDAGSISTMDNVYIDAAYANISNIDASSSITRIFLDNILVFTNAPLSLGANVYGFNQDINLGQLQAGTHELKMIVDAAGQVSESNESNNIYTKNFTVICNTPAQPSTITGNATTCQSVSQTYTVTNVPGITFTWAVTGGSITSGQGTNSVTIFFTAGGTQTISVTASNNCASGTTRTRTVAVTALPSQPSAITGTTVVCLGTGTQTYSVTNTPGVIYSWSVTGGTFTSSGNSITVTWNTVGNQSIIVTPSNSCGSGISRSLGVIVNTVPSQPSAISGNATACIGTAQPYSVINISGVSYNWVSTGATITGSGNQVNIAWSTNGVKTISVTPSNSCGTAISQNLTVTVNNNPTATVSPVTATICQGAGITLTASGGTSYSWSNGLGTGATKTVAPITSTTYSVTATDNNGCTSSASRIVNVNAIPAAAISPSTATICVGSSISLTATGGVTYAWGNGLGAGNVKVVSPTTTTNYTVTVTGSNSCSASASKTVTVIVPPAAPMITSSGSLNPCVGTGIVTLATSATGVTYQWQRNGSNILGATSATYSTTQSGTYTLVVSNYCPSAVSNVIYVTPASVIMVTNTNDSGVGSLREAINCANSNTNVDSIHFSIPGSGAQIISLLSALPKLSGNNIIIDGFTQQDIVISGPASGTNSTLEVGASNIVIRGLKFSSAVWAAVQVSVTDSCKILNNVFENNSAGLRLNNNTTPSSTLRNILIQNNSFETNQTGLLVWASSYLGVQIKQNQFFNNSKAISGFSFAATGLINVSSFSISENTIYNNSSAGISFPDEEYDNISISKNSVYCNTGLGGIQLSAGANNNVQPPVISSLTVSTITGTSSPNSAVEVFISDNIGCTSAPCQGKTFLGTANADINGNWSLNSPFTTTLHGGQRITTTATLANNTSIFSGCFTVPCALQVNIIAVDTQICNGSTTTLNVPTGFASYNWSTGAQINHINVSTLGNYSVTVTDTLGCTASDNQIVTAKPSPIVSVTPSNATICQGASITLTANGAASYNWNNGLGAGGVKTVAPTSTTVYTVTGTDNQGCTASASKTVNVNSLPNASISPSSISICSGSSTTLTASGGGTYLWSNSLGTNPHVSVLPSTNTTYTVTVTGTNSCTATASSSVSLSPSVIPDITIQPNKTTACAVDTITFTANVVNGGSIPVYQWQKNGINVGSNSSGYTAINPIGTDVFRCILTSNAICASPVKDTSNNVSITVVPSVTPTISIVATNVNYCTNQLFSWSATTTDGGVNPSYEWYIGGVPQGVNSSSYSTAMALPLFGGASITCVLTSSANCASPQTVTSNTLITPPVGFPASIGQPQGPSSACVGDTSTYTASPGGSTSITWAVNNGTIISGQGTTSVRILWQQEGSNIISVVGSNACGSSAVNQQKMITVGAPSNITIITNDTSVCDNTSPVFTAIVTSPGTNSVYQWKLNGVNVGSSTNTYTLPNPTAGNTVSCIYTSTNACSSSPNDTSNFIIVTTLQSPANPAVTMIPSVWCDGNPTYLQASSCIGCTYQWNQSKLIPMIGLIVVPLNGNGNMVSVGEIQPGFTVNVTVTNANGCSSSTSSSFQATQLPNSASIITATTCQNNPYNFNGTNMASSGSFTDTLQSANGCDSVITLNLTVLPAYTTIIEESICAGTSYYFKGQNIVAAGVYLDTLQSSSSCDSIIQLILTVNNPSASSINASICQGSSYFFNNQNLTTAGTYTDTILNSLSCDSIITLFLSVDVPPAKPTITVIGDTAFCLGDSAILQTTNTSGTLLWNTNETTSFITVTTANFYNVQVTNQCGNAMSDNQQISVFALPAQPNILQNADTLTSSILANSYQWYHNQAIINGAITQSIVPTQNGNYVVEITDVNGCKNTSAIYNYTSAGLSTDLNPLYVQIIPNPNSGQFTIQFSDNIQHNVSITDVLGRVLAKESVTGTKQIVNQGWMDGVYFLNVISTDQTSSLKFIIAK